MRTKQKCTNCTNWIDATAECAQMLVMQINDQDISDEMQSALDRDSCCLNQCESYTKI